MAHFHSAKPVLELFGLVENAASASLETENRSSSSSSSLSTTKEIESMLFSIHFGTDLFAGALVSALPSTTADDLLLKRKSQNPSLD
ncbi:2190_t:CDS:2 [Funneliformis mosseae]|uniref:2190_t:CDS:1 n=1 Tax=Funneliformis mosseae TaxID=27381 RepID=A0A9N9BCQ9_FUNMO|nr:2190_t:CDS:2 [Funneliformis mosseae]